MDDGDTKLSDNAMLLNPELSSDFQSLTCTHTHTCNPPGPDSVHMHTCYHTHTQVFASEEDDTQHTKSKAKKPSSNREAVRKYREKKKAHTAYLEEEIERLRLQHVYLVRKLQKQAVLEAELSRLRSIVVDLGRKMDNELRVFPSMKQCTSYDQTSFSCFNSSLAGSSSQVAKCGNGKFSARWEGNSQSAIVDCQVNIEKKASTEEGGEEDDGESLEGEE